MEKTKGLEKSEGPRFYTVDSFSNGIAFGQHCLPGGADPRRYYGLRLLDDPEVVQLRSHYQVHRDNPLSELEKQLLRLSKAGILGSSSIHFGTSTDPFVPFEGKFDSSMKFLELFMRYTPGFLNIQTRSPLVVLAMPVFKKLQDRVGVTIAIETPKDEVAERYTPGMPTVRERLEAATTLGRLGVDVTLQVAPVLPYGDWRADAGAFAELLIAHASHLSVRALMDGSAKTENRVKQSVLGRRLAQDRRYHWLRPDSAGPLLAEIRMRSPDILNLPKRKYLGPRQLEIFAA